MDQLNVTVGLFGLVVVILGITAEIVRRYLAAEPLVALLAGFLLGPAVAGVVTPDTWSIDVRVVLEQGARLTLAIGLMEIGLSLRAGAMRRLGRSLLFRLGLVLPVTTVLGAALVALIFGMPVWPALAIGAAIAATDPIISSAVVSGELARSSLPVRLRDALSAESAANDGLVYAFVMLPVLFITEPGSALSQWLLHSVLLGVVGAVAIGAGFGWVAGGLAARARADESYRDPALLALTMALAVVVLALVRAIGSDGILAVFAAALTFDRRIEQREAEERRIRNVVNRFFMLPIFLVLGAALPVAEWLDLGWAALLLAVLALLIRRLPVFLLLRRAAPCVRDLPSAAFTGWFGPIGIAALYYAILVTRETGDERVWVLGTLLIVASVIAHGLTAAPLARWYGRATGYTERQSNT